jgi:hypothetical protein
MSYGIPVGNETPGHGEPICCANRLCRFSFVSGGGRGIMRGCHEINFCHRGHRGHSVFCNIIVNIMAAVLFCVYVRVRFHHSPSNHYYIRYFPIFQHFFLFFSNSHFSHGRTRIKHGLTQKNSIKQR